MSSYTGSVSYRRFWDTIHHKFRAEITQDLHSPSHWIIEIFWDENTEGVKASVRESGFPTSNERGLVLEALKNRATLPGFPYMVQDFKIVWFT